MMDATRENPYRCPRPSHNGEYDIPGGSVVRIVTKTGVYEGTIFINPKKEAALGYPGDMIMLLNSFKVTKKNDFFKPMSGVLKLLNKDIEKGLF